MDKWLRNTYVSVRRNFDCVRLLGMSGVNLILRSWAGSRAQMKISVNSMDMWIRLNSTDLATLLQIFWNREYEFDIAVEPEVVIDAGANVGYSTLYLAQRFPKARIIAIEPHPENFSQLEKNTSANANITALQAAVWFEDKALGLWDPNEGHWGFRVSENSSDEPEIEIQGRSIDSIMEELGLAHVDILKLDIEGSEKEVFEHSAAWIDRVAVIIAELHDKYRKGCARAFYNATNTFPFEQHIGENILIMKESYIPPALSAQLDHSRHIE